MEPAMTTETTDETKHPPSPSPWLTTSEAANHFRLSRSTLENYRTGKGGSPWRSVGRKVLYRRDELDAWASAGAPPPI
ncbi:MAG: helix-turn-helix domain-containing protein [Ferrovibrionaceae bacterium]